MARCTEAAVGIRIIGRSMLFQYHSTPEALAKTDPIENNALLLECSLHILYPASMFHVYHVYGSVQQVHGKIFLDFMAPKLLLSNLFFVYTLLNEHSNGKWTL